MSYCKVCDRCGAKFPPPGLAENPQREQWSEWRIGAGRIKHTIDFCGKCTRIVQKLFPLPVHQAFYFKGAEKAGAEARSFQDPLLQSNQ